jgi:hypothetical protein
MSLDCSAIFCEDIRHEVGEKRSFIGVHSGRSNLARFPFLFPKFCIVLFAHAGLGEHPKKASVTLRMDGEVFAELPETDYSLRVRELEEKRAEHSLVSMEMIISPFVVDKPCDLNVEFHLDGKKMRIPTLRFAQLSPEAAKKLSSPRVIASGVIEGTMPALSKTKKKEALKTSAKKAAKRTTKRP